MNQPILNTSTPFATTKSLSLRPSMSVAARQSSTELITIEAGPERKRYLLHKGFLTHYSEYFRNALRGPWKEADERVIPLVDIEPGILNIFVNWLYTQQLPHEAEMLSVAEVEGNPPPYETVSLLLAKAVAFSDRFMAPKFYEDVSFQSIRRLQYGRPDYATIIFAFDNLPSNAPLLGHMVFAHCCDRNSLDELDSEKALKSQLPRDFLLRVMDTYGEMQSLGHLPLAYFHHPQVNQQVTQQNMPIADAHSDFDDPLLDSDSDVGSGSQSSGNDYL